MTRSISIGTDMVSSVISLQKARPWYMNKDQGSNKAVDNAVTLRDLFENRTVALFAVPAPFTGTCTNEHFPGFQKLQDEIREAGADEIVCVSVADPYSMHGWQLALGNDSSKITFLADPDATFAKAFGVDRDYSECSLGLRSERFSMIVSNGIVNSFKIVKDAAKDAEELLKELRDIKENEDVLQESFVEG